MNTYTDTARAAPSHADIAPVLAQTPDLPEQWRPEPCGISREEMRAIVAEMLG